MTKAMIYEYMGNKKDVDGLTHLALSVMAVIAKNGWGRKYPKEISEIMEKLLKLDRRCQKEEQK